MNEKIREIVVLNARFGAIEELLVSKGIVTKEELSNLFTELFKEELRLFDMEVYLNE